MAVTQDRSAFFARWGLSDCRKCPQQRPAPHQERALQGLHRWYEQASKKGGILVLPTGGGKTFTAIQFLCAGPLSDGMKVLWLAHTHHLLEQAFFSFQGNTMGSISEKRRELRLRVVSGTPGHYPPRDIEPDDDIVIATLQTITNADRNDLKELKGFLKAAGDRLFVVFDEAHHAPAPSYRKLLQRLNAPVLGLTATPLYSDETKQGWLKKLFPDGILAQVRATELMAAGVLARPHLVPFTTSFSPSFEDAEYEKWLGSYGDIPEEIIDQLANNAERNKFIARTYADNRQKFGKTIIFTDRWYQCVAIEQALTQMGIRTGSVFSHVDGRFTTVAERRKRDRDENSKVLQRFRRGELDVVINVRMLTEGTDIPDAQTVFLTRQTTSKILLTQMVGRALRGPKFGGTADAYVVSFVDNWQQQIQWAEWDLPDGSADEGERPRAARPPLQLISIDLIKRLSRQMLGKIRVDSLPFKALLPVGWYRTLFDARASAAHDMGDDVEPKEVLAMVFEDERDGFDGLIKHLMKSVPEALAAEDASLSQHVDQLSEWQSRFFASARRQSNDLLVDIFHIARHVAQRASAPQFFSFEMRDAHDVDLLARSAIDKRLDPISIEQNLRSEYERVDRFWRVLFHQYDLFRQFHDMSLRRLVVDGSRQTSVEPTSGTGVPPSQSEPDEAVKEEVKHRDGRACLACGVRRTLHVDHIVSAYHGGSGDPDNLQTLCRRCNQQKGTRTLRFRTRSTTLSVSPRALPQFTPPDDEDAANPEAWERFLRATINFFFECGAVSQVQIAGKGDGYYHWTVALMSGNAPAWLAEYLPSLLSTIQAVRRSGGKPHIKSLRITAPGRPDEIIVQPVALAPSNPFHRKEDPVAHGAYKFLSRRSIGHEDDVDGMIATYVDKTYEATESARNKCIRDIKAAFIRQEAITFPNVK